MTVPFVDLRAQYQAIKPDIDGAIRDVVENTSFIGGAAVRQFEEAFAHMLGVKHCVGVGNGTDAIYISLKILGIGAGDEVITTALSWISTSETITQAGAVPVFVDINPDNFTIDVAKIKSKISSRTKAIIPVHLYGHAAEIRAIKDLCLEYGLYLIEDCAQSHLSEDVGQFVGTFGDMATFSFYPGKNLGAYGDAGAIITNDDQLASKARMYANHGALKKHEHLVEGINSRLDTLQASILLAKLPHLKEWTVRRIKNAALYNELLSNVPGIILPKTRERSIHTFHLYVIRCQNRDVLQRKLLDCGIQTAIHYPRALPNLPAYRYLGHKPTDFAVASNYQNEILSLPMYPELSEEQIGYVCRCIKGLVQA
ncbi:MAG: DegT/DnrJ/EryC1/StrS family aminotransferase [Cyclobacteriaceae bacterium]